MSSSTRSSLEMAGVILTGVAHLSLAEAPGAKPAFIAFALVAWASYIAVRVRKNSRLPGLWGFCRTNIRKAFLVSSGAAVVGVGVMALIGLSRGTLYLHWHMLPLLLLYPIWGLTQQFLIQALVAGNLSRVSGLVGSAWFVTAVCAALFGAVHLPDPTLAIGTFFLGVAFTPIYLRWRNLWPLGIYHGALGVFVYFWVLNRDPWIEVFGRF